MSRWLELSRLIVADFQPPRNTLLVNHFRSSLNSMVSVSRVPDYLVLTDAERGDPDADTEEGQLETPKSSFCSTHASFVESQGWRYELALRTSTYRSI